MTNNFIDFFPIEKEEVDLDCGFFSDPINNNLDEEDSEDDEYDGTFISVLGAKPKPKKKKDLIKNSVVFGGSDNLSSKFSLRSMASSLYYNHFHLNKKLKLNSIKNSSIIIFNQVYEMNNKFDAEQVEQIKSSFDSIILMTYRNSFNNLNKKGLKNCTTDCGWGCMIRACQMMLAKCILEKKKFNLSRALNRKLKSSDIVEIKKETLLLFYDNNISYQSIKDNPDYLPFLKKISEMPEAKQGSNPIEVTPPYSIQTICQITDSVGQWNSDCSVIKAILTINQHFFNDQDSYLYFPSTDISEKTIYQNFCKEHFCHCKGETSGESERTLCKKCFEEILKENENLKNMKQYFIKDKNIYKFSKQGVIFISFRVGYEVIEKEYYPILTNFLTDVRNNAGFVCGKIKRAFYFIGKSGENFLYLDPHLNQTSIDPSKDNISSYEVKNIYEIQKEKMLPQFSFAVFINDNIDLNNFIDDIKKLKSDVIRLV